MGTLASVPIEPDSQTALLDHCCSHCSGVIGGGVPGAGGFDAIWVLVLDDEASNKDERQEETPETQVKRVWREWKEMNVSSLSSKAKISGGGSAEEQGLRLHRIEEVEGLGRFFAS